MVSYNKWSCCSGEHKAVKIHTVKRIMWEDKKHNDYIWAAILNFKYLAPDIKN